MKNLLIIPFLLFAVLCQAQFSSESNIEDTEEESSEIETWYSNHIHNQDRAFISPKPNLNVLYLAQERRDVQTLFFNAPIGDNFQVDAGFLFSDFERFAQGLGLSYSIPLNERLRIELRAKSLISEDFEDYVFNPQVVVSYGTMRKNLSIGLGGIAGSNFDGFEIMAIGDLLYTNGGILIGASYPITSQFSVVTDNNIVRSDGISLLTNFSSIVFDSPDQFSISVGFFHQRFSFGGFSDSETNFVVGLAYNF